MDESLVLVDSYGKKTWYIFISDMGALVEIDILLKYDGGKYRSIGNSMLARMAAATTIAKKPLSHLIFLLYNVNTGLITSPIRQPLFARGHVFFCIRPELIGVCKKWQYRNQKIIFYTKTMASYYCPFKIYLSHGASALPINAPLRPQLNITSGRWVDSFHLE